MCLALYVTPTLYIVIELQVHVSSSVSTSVHEWYKMLGSRLYSKALLQTLTYAVLHRVWLVNIYTQQVYLYIMLTSKTL